MDKFERLGTARKYIEEAKNNIGRKLTVAGWVHELRDLGKVRFVLLRDKTGMVQVTAKKGEVSDDILKLMDLQKETVIEVTGTVREMKNAPDGIELVPETLQVLGTVSMKLPIDVSDMVPAELDTRLNYRYIDLRREIPKAIFSIKSVVANSFRNYLYGHGYTEIFTPCIISAASEGGANLFPIIYFDREAFLAQSPQLYKQIAVVGGMDKVFMTVPAFRAEKHNTTCHLNEVIQMDIEQGFANHHDVMDVSAAVFTHVLKTVNEKCKAELAVLKTEVKVPSEVKRYTYSEVVELLNKNDFKMEWGEDFTRETERAVFNILKEELYFIYDWPTQIRAFYSMPNDDEKTCKGFDLMYRGLEISSGAQRIHIPELLITQLKKRGLNPTDFDFYIRAFRAGAPPHAGWSIGLERATMVICDQKNIREVAMFPRDRTRLTP